MYERKTTAPGASVGADAGQPLQKNYEPSIPGGAAEINPAFEAAPWLQWNPWNPLCDDCDGCDGDIGTPSGIVTIVTTVTENTDFHLPSGSKQGQNGGQSENRFFLVKSRGTSKLSNHSRSDGLSLLERLENEKSLFCPVHEPGKTAGKCPSLAERAKKELL